MGCEPGGRSDRKRESPVVIQSAALLQERWGGPPGGAELRGSDRGSRLSRRRHDTPVAQISPVVDTARVPFASCALPWGAGGKAVVRSTGASAFRRKRRRLALSPVARGPQSRMLA